MAAKGIIPSAIPGNDLDPDAVLAAADAIGRLGGSVRDRGAETVQVWRRIASYYEAPEAPTLFSVMDPVETKSLAFGDDVEGVAAALRRFAEDIRPIKASLASVRRDAYAFRSKIASNSEWQYDQDLVDQNTALVARVNDQQVRLWEAERRCANAIRALYGAQPWHAANGSGDGLEYGVDALPTSEQMPWGAAVDRKDHCPKAAGVQVKRFVWDGVVVDGLWGTVVGIGQMVGIKDWSWSWDTMKTTWQGIGGLIGYDMTTGEWSGGTAGDAWLNLGKGLIAWDMWSEDPARALGGAGFNVLTVVIPAGAAVQGLKGAGAAGKAGNVSRFLATGAKIIDFTDPAALAIMGVKSLPRVGDALASLRLAASGALDDLLRVPDFSTPNLDLPGGNGVRGLDDLDGFTVPRDPDVLPDRAPQPAEVPAPVREAVGPDGSPVPGGIGHGADDLLDGGRPGSSTGGPGSDAPTSGSHTPAGPDAPGSGGSGGGSGGSGGGSGAPGHGATPGGGGADGGTPGGQGDTGGPGDTGGAGTPRGEVPDGPDRIAIDSEGQPHAISTSDNLVEPQVPFNKVLQQVLDANGLTRAKFQELLQTHVADLTRDQAKTLLAIRDAMPGLDENTVLQKVITPQQALDILGVDAARFMEDGLHARATSLGATPLGDIGGFVSRAADVIGAKPAQIYHQLGLTYPGTPFHPQGESVFTVRFRGSDAVAVSDNMLAMPGTPDGTLRAIAAMPDRIHQITDPVQRRAEMQAWIDTNASNTSFDAVRALDPDNPFRGNGFSGESSAYSPELSYGPTKIRVPEGSELWRVRPDGTQEIAAVYSKGAWRTIVDPPAGPTRGPDGPTGGPLTGPTGAVDGFATRGTDAAAGAAGRALPDVGDAGRAAPDAGDGRPATSPEPEGAASRETPSAPRETPGTEMASRPDGPAGETVGRPEGTTTAEAATGAATRAGSDAASAADTTPVPDAAASPDRTNGPDATTTPDAAAPTPEVVHDANGVAYTVRMAEDAVANAPQWEDVLTRELADRGLSRGEFDRLVSQPIHRLTKSDVLTLLAIREALPPISPEDILQKILPPEQVRNMIGADAFDALAEPEILRRLREAEGWMIRSGEDAGEPAVRMGVRPEEIRGYVARLADVTGLSSTRLYHDLGLGYIHSIFSPDQSMFALRFQAGDLDGIISDPTSAQFTPVRANQPLEVMRDAIYEPATDGSGRSRFDEIMALTDEGDRRQAWSDYADTSQRGFSMRLALDRYNPHRGNGFGGTGQLYAPELTFGLSKTPIRPGAEMWQITPDGSSRIVAVFDGDDWQTVR